METYLTRVTDYLLTQSWQIALLVVVIAAVSLVLRNKSAHVRYLLWLIVLAKCLVPPLLTVPVAILPQEKPAVVFEATATTISEPLELPLEPVKLTPAPMFRERPTKVDIRPWLGAGWMLGAIAFLVFNLLKALRASLWLWRQRKALPAELLSDIENLFSAHGIKSFPGVWQIDGISQPFVWGLLRGSIYLPADLLSVKNPERCRNLLGHELSHVIRFDAAVNFLQVVVQAIFWFHPFVWWANRKIRAEREKCCDEMAIARLNASPRDYSTAIVEILAAKHESTRPVPSLAVAGPVKNIEERIKTMMRPRKKFYKRPSLVAVVVVLLIALLTVPTALVLTARAETKTEAERTEKPTKSLRESATDGDIHQIRLHLSTGTAVNIKDGKGRTALHHAASEGHTEIARLLIAQGANVNAKGENGQTPLHHAAVNGKTEMADLLILKGADVNAKNKSGLTSVSRALLSEGGGRRMVELLVRKGAQVSALHLAAHRGDIDKVRSSLEKGTNVDVRDEAGHTPLYYAASAGQMHVVEFLISKGAEVDAKDNRGGETPLFYAGDAGWRNVAELLIAKGADVNARGSERSGALESAAWRGRGDVAELLIAEGADVNAKDNWDYIPLHAAASSGLVEVAELLIAKGSDPDAKTEWGETPLHSAIKSGQTHMVEVLIAKGADVNAKDKWGETPLHYAVAEGNRDMVEPLIAKGADINAKDNRGRTPLQIAEDKSQTEIVKLLRKHATKE